MISRRKILAASTLGPMAAAAMAAQAAPVYGKAPRQRIPFDPGDMRQSTMALLKQDSFRGLPKQIFDATEKAFPGHLTEQVPWKEGSYDWFDHSGAKWEDLVKE